MGEQPSLTGAHALVLGGGGFIGTALSVALKHAGASVSVFSRNTAPSRDHAPVDRWIEGDFLDVDALGATLDGVTHVFHLINGSIPQSANWNARIDLDLNVVPTLELLKLCAARGIRKFVFASSGGTVYGPPDLVPIPETAATDPISAYGIGKLAVEKYLHLFLHHHGLDYQVLRLANPYGPNQHPHRPQGVVANMLYRALTGEPFTIWGTGEIARDFVHVADVADAIVRSAVYEGPHRVMNVGGGSARSVNQIAVDIETALGLSNYPRIFLEGRSFDVPVNFLDIELIRREVGWAPATPWSEGLAGTAAWMREALENGTLRSPPTT